MAQTRRTFEFAYCVGQILDVYTLKMLPDIDALGQDWEILRQELSVT